MPAFEPLDGVVVLETRFLDDGAVVVAAPAAEEAPALQPGAEGRSRELLKVTEAAFKNAAKSPTLNLHALGTALDPVLGGHLYQAHGAGSFEEYCTDFLGIDAWTGKALVEIAQRFSPAEYAFQSGPGTPIGLALFRDDAGRDLPEELLTMVLKHGSGAGKWFIQATHGELVETIVGARGEEPPPTDPSLPPATLESMKTLVAMLGGGTRVSVVRVWSSKERSYDWTCSISGSIAEMSAPVLRALQGMKKERK